MMYLPTLCTACKNFHLGSGRQIDVAATCDAYPQGIPEDFWQGGSAHIDPVADGSDGGIVFEGHPDDPRLVQVTIETFTSFWDELTEDTGEDE